MTNNIKVETEVLTLKKVHKKYQFIIPCYQRPYTWSDEDVLKLFDDIKTAHDTDKKSNYFIGTVLTSLDNSIYELIDGQQRITTLMLIAIAFKSAKLVHPLVELAALDNKPRLQFSIRDQVQHLLGSLAELENYQKPSSEQIESDFYLTRIDAALTVLKQQVESLAENKREDLAEYIYSKVQWVNNIVPHQMNLNRLFATMNTSGIQLEQTDILKSKLLEKITENKSIFDGIWSVCEYMENYFERNVRRVFHADDWNVIKPEQLEKFSYQLLSMNPIEEHSEINGQKRTIDELHKQLTDIGAPDSLQEKYFNTSDDDIEKLKEETVFCRSIIQFPLLLIHAYRIYLAKNNKPDIEPRLHSSRLLEIFEPLIQSNDDDIKSFLYTLWKVRYQFDKWVIKWVERDDSDKEELALTNISAPTSSSNYINRSRKELSALAQLQSVRNFTGERSAQYWLSPFIGGLLDKEINDENALSLMESIDNQLSLVTGTQKEASFEITKGGKPNVAVWQERQNYFSESRGTSFEHYWFQKLEYLLWKDLKKLESSMSKETSRFKNYRITPKNSIEHIHPQNNSKLENEWLHHFGNLVLLSPGQNSSYSDKFVSVKRAEFMAKTGYDSLKSKHIFDLLGDDSDWTKANIEQHHKDMLEVLTNHYGIK